MGGIFQDALALQAARPAHQIGHHVRHVGHGVDERFIQQPQPSADLFYCEQDMHHVERVAGQPVGYRSEKHVTRTEAGQQRIQFGPLIGVLAATLLLIN